MLKLIAVLTSIFLIGIISLSMPEANVGLDSFASKSNFLGSPRSAQRFLNIIIAIAIIIYFGVALQLNLLNR